MLILCSICVVILFIVNLTFHWFCYLFIFCLFIVIHLCCLCLWGLWLLVRFNRICMCLWCCFVIWTVISNTVTSYFCVLCHSWDFSRSGCDLLYGSLLFLCIVSLVGFFFSIEIVISCTVPYYLYALLMLFCHPDCDFLYGSLVFVCYALLVFLVSSTWIVIVFGTFVSSALCCLSVLWFFVRFSLISILYLLELCYARNLCMLNI